MVEPDDLVENIQCKKLLVQVNAAVHCRQANGYVSIKNALQKSRVQTREGYS